MEELQAIFADEKKRLFLKIAQLKQVEVEFNGMRQRYADMSSNTQSLETAKAQAHHEIDRLGAVISDQEA